MSENVYKKGGRKLHLLLMLLAVIGSAFPVYSEVSGPDTNRAGQLKLEDFIRSIEHQYQVSFVYDATQIKKEKLITADPNLSPLESALKQLPPNGINYKIVSNKVVLKKAELEMTALQRKDIVVKGTVSIKTPGGTEKVPGVYILEKGTKNATASDPNGEFTLRVQEGAVLVFSMIGYKAREVAVSGRLSVDVTLEEDVSALKEVVVTGYQNLNRKMFTGAATTVKGSDIKQEGIVDVSRMLEGRVAGVSVQNVSGTFGAAPKIRVRGATSISGENKPLWVVDGVVLEDVVNISNDQLASGDATTLIGSAVAGLNAEDIESFNVLKDASATALYGARAMNGVVVITTKKGRVGKPVVTYTGNFSTFAKPSYSNFNIMNSADQMSVYSEVARKGGLNASIVNGMNGGVYTKMYQQMSYNDATGQFGVANTPEGRSAFLQRYATANTDWFDVLFRNSFVQEHSVSISSGTDKSQHYFSAGYYNDNGWTIADNVKRYTMNLRGNYQFGSKFTAGVIAAGSIRDQRAPGTLGRTNNVVEGNYSRDFDLNPFSYALNTSRTMTPYDENGNLEYFTRFWAPFNIINETKTNYIDLGQLDMKLQGEVGYKILKNLEFKSLGAIRYVKTTREHKITEFSNMATAYRYAPNSTIANANLFLYNDPDRPEIIDKETVLPQGGFYNRNDDNLVNYYVRNTLNWTYDFGTKPQMITVLAGQELKFADRQNSFSNGYGYQYDKGGTPFIDYKAIKQAIEGNFNYFGMDMLYDRFASFFTNATYSYDSKYIFNGTLRYDGSNKLGQSRQARWLPTWTLSGAWNIDSEPFMQDVKEVSYLKLRASYGLTASMGSATNSLAVFLNSSSRRPRLTEVEPRIEIDALENSELTWEKQYEKNIGVDAGLFDNKLTLAVDFYKRDGFDLISSLRTSGIGGESTKQANYADMKSHGIEFAIGNRLLKTTRFNWSSNLTFGYNKNKITNLKNTPRIFDLVIPEGGALEGGAVRGLYSIDFQGLNGIGIPTFIDESGALSTGVYLQSRDVAYLKYEGSVDPTITGGLSNTLKYKDFSLNIFFSYQAGNKIRLNPVFKSNYSDADAMPKEFLDRWTLPGDENTTTTPSIASYFVANGFGGLYPYNTYNYSSVRVADGSFVRMKTVSLGYTLPEKWAKAIGGANLSATLVGNNLWLLYADKKLKGQDPEFFSSGGVALPVPRQITLNLRASF